MYLACVRLSRTDFIDHLVQVERDDSAFLVTCPPLWLLYQGEIWLYLRFRWAISQQFYKNPTDIF